MAGDQTELLIKINGDIKNFDKALDDAEKKTEDFNGKLETLTKLSGLAFAGFAASIGLATKAYGVQEQAVNQLNNALQLQGIYTKALSEDYKKQADAIEALTGLDSDAIIAGQAKLQGYLGEIKITQELTNAVTDLAAAKGIDLEQAFELVGKSIGTHTNALARNGIELDTNASKTEKLSKLVEQIQGNFKGAAEANAQGVNSYKVLFGILGNISKQLGERFAPLVENITGGLIRMFKSIEANKPLLDLIASLTIGATVFAGLVTVLGTLGLAFVKFQAVMKAAQLSTTAMSLATKGLVGATGLGLLAIVITEIALNWNTIWPRMQAVFSAFANNIMALLNGLGKALKGAFTFDLTLLKQGLDDATKAIATGYDQATAIIVQKEQERTVKMTEEMKARKEILAAIEEEDVAANAERKAILDEEILAQNEEFQALSEEQQATFRERNKQELQTSIETQKTTRDIVAKESIQRQIKEHNEYLKNEQKFGVAYATIHRAINSERVTAAAGLAGQLSVLQSSGNNTLKSIGKAGGLAQISIDTAKGAVSAYSGAITAFGPIFGPPIGTAAAVALIAFGAEQASKITAAKDGGLLTGGIPGVDSIPVLAQQNELISPAQNFDEVIGSVRAKREADKLTEENGGVLPGGGAPSLTVNVQGNIIANSQEHIDNLINDIRDRVEFGNAQLLPV